MDAEKTPDAAQIVNPAQTDTDFQTAATDQISKFEENNPEKVENSRKKEVDNWQEVGILKLEKDAESRLEETNETEARRKQRAETLGQNRKKGRETEQKLGAIFSNLLRALRTQVTIQIKGTDLRFRADAIGYEITESGESKLKMLEFKSSKTARLTPNQKEAFKLLQSHDGVVAGRKKRGLLYGEGFVIPASTIIEIIRLDEGGNWYVSDRFG